MTKIVINRCYDGFSVSEEACKFMGIEYDGFGALERLREQLAKGQKLDKIEHKFVPLSDTDKERIKKEINLLEERTRV